MNFLSSKNKWVSFFTDSKTVMAIYTILATGISFQLYLLEKKHLGPGLPGYTQYNNYVIFKQAHFHLLAGKNMYALYLQECWDYYKYSPAFALLFGVFAYLPDLVGLIGWNLLNALILYFAIRKLPGTENRRRNAMLLFTAFELITSLQSAQSNGLMAGLIIFAFVFLENRNYLLATLFICLSIYIKLFGMVAILLFIFYPEKWKLALYTAMWALLLFLLPLLVVPHHELFHLYTQWWDLVKTDPPTTNGLSVMHWLNDWFGISMNTARMVAMPLGLVLLLAPLIRVKYYKNSLFRISMIASLLIWVVIFNHKAESPTFVIAMSGVALWYYAMPRKNMDMVLAIIALVFTSLSVTDLFPPFLRESFVYPYAIKAFPCILVWLRIVHELLTGNFRKLAPVISIHS